MQDSSPKGLPGEFLLLFTFLIWLLFFLIYIGNRHNKLNRWCFISGICFSIGVLKEYLYYSLFPWVIQSYPSLLDEGTALTIYSVLTAIPYYFATPTMLIFSLYFNRFELRHPKAFPWICILSFVPGIVFGFFYPYTQTRYFQLNDRTYYMLVTIYNFINSIVMTYMILNTLTRERHSKIRQQKRAIAFLVLVPSWYAMLSIFPVQLFGIGRMFKTWQGNLVIIMILILFYLYHVSRDGFMGARFRHETYDWDKDSQLINKSMELVQHMLKNQIAKIDWCAQNIVKEAPSEEIEEYTEIIRRSTSRVSGYISKTKSYSQELNPRPEHCDAQSFLKSCYEDLEKVHKEVVFELDCQEAQTVYCDRDLLKEVLLNLFQNAIDAMDGTGKISISCYQEKHGSYCCIEVADTGKGIEKEDLIKLFQPYYTTKRTDAHTGLGLYYCQKVLLKHDGEIRVKSENGCGTVFYLYLPQLRKRGLTRKERR